MRLDAWTRSGHPFAVYPTDGIMPLSDASERLLVVESNSGTNWTRRSRPVTTPTPLRKLRLSSQEFFEQAHSYAYNTPRSIPNSASLFSHPPRAFTGPQAAWSLKPHPLIPSRSPSAYAT